VGEIIARFEKRGYKLGVTGMLILVSSLLRWRWFMLRRNIWRSIVFPRLGAWIDFFYRQRSIFKTLLPWVYHSSFKSHLTF
jgi:nucleoside diphosphate kinase